MKIGQQPRHASFGSHEFKGPKEAGKGLPPHEGGGQPPNFPEKYKSPFGGHGRPDDQHCKDSQKGKPPMQAEGDSPT